MNWSKTIYVSDKVHRNVWLDEIPIDESPHTHNMWRCYHSRRKMMSKAEKNVWCDWAALRDVTVQVNKPETNSSQCNRARCGGDGESHTEFFFREEENSRHDKVKRIVVCSALAQFINPPRYAVGIFFFRGDEVNFFAFVVFPEINTTKIMREFSTPVRKRVRTISYFIELFIYVWSALEWALSIL